VDFGRYLIDLVVFVGITVVLMCSFHVLVLRHKKRNFAKLPRPKKRLLPGRDAQAGSGRSHVRVLHACDQRAAVTGVQRP
jgi:hypothetical protein